MIRSFLLQLGLYTTLYSSVHLWDEKSYKMGLLFVPLIGLLLGGILYGLSLALPVNLQPFMLVLVYCLLTGGLHMDGFGDTLDGFLARRGREEALRIMKDPHLGTFGLLGVLLLLLGYYSFMTESGKLLLLLPAVGRFSPMLVAYKKNYAREQGMGKLFVESLNLSQSIPWLFILGLLHFLLGEWIYLLTFILSILFSLLMGLWCKRSIGGMTGDTIGFTIEATQLFYLLAYTLLEALWI